jgi:hypothetical protein
MKKLWLALLGAGAAVVSYLIVVSIPDIKRYVRMRQI